MIRKHTRYVEEEVKVGCTSTNSIGPSTHTYYYGNDWIRSFPACHTLWIKGQGMASTGVY